MTEIAGVHGPAYGEILALVSDPDQRAIEASSEGGLVAYGEIPATFPATLLGDKTIRASVTVPEAGYVKFWDIANMRLGMIPSGSGWKPYAYVISPEGDQTILGTELAEGSDQVILAATYEQSTGTLTLFVDDVPDGDVSFGEARDTLAGLPIWQAGAAAGGYVTDCGLWDSVIDFANPPTVTIEQGASQTDPEHGASIVFDVVFSEAGSGFNTGDVSFTGSTAGGTLVGTVSGSGPSYTVTVSGMSSSGTVVASIPAGVFTATATGLTNEASTSSDNSVQWYLTYSDDFNRSNSTNLGSFWNEREGDFSISGSRLAYNNASEGQVQCTQDLGSADHTVEASIITASLSGVFARSPGSWAETYYYARHNNVTGNFELYKRVSGTFTLLGSTAGSFASNDVFTLECIGTAIKFYVNNVLTVSVTDSSITTGNFGGLRMIGTNVFADNFRCWAN